MTPGLRPRALTIMLPAALVLCGVSEGIAQGSDLRAVQNRIAGLLTHPILREARVSVLVVSLDSDREVFSRNASLRLIPASNMKLVVGATALELLGPDWDCSALPGARPGETLARLASRIQKPSDNALSEALMAALPAAAGRPDLSPEQLCAETWGERGFFLRGERWPDGSGLSRSALMSAETVVKLLRYMDGASSREQFIAALPVSGVDGTLRNRMKGTVAEGRVRAKTGSLTGVSALSGYLETMHGERLVFAIIFNGFTCELPRVRRLQDQLCSALVTLQREDVCAEPQSGH